MPVDVFQAHVSHQIDANANKQELDIDAAQDEGDNTSGAQETESSATSDEQPPVNDAQPAGDGTLFTGQKKAPF